MDYNTLVYKLGSLHSLLQEMNEAGLYQGEHTIVYSAKGVTKTLHVYIDGSDLQMSDSPTNPGIHFSTSALPDEQL